MDTPDLLPDLPHVAQIGRHLWDTSPTGRATVMVGAGFSLNAEPKTTAPRPFPLWFDLAELMFTALYPAVQEGDNRDRRVEAAAANGGLLTLALEFDAAFGRERLDQLVLDAVPDDHHDPGELHRLLLTLPWADVLTTNYDTLLERARAAVHDRRYSVVHAAHDLPSARRPRIVKLHGSLRSHRPFILTEEDYRLYPRNSAPFINTVRQALMETALVLVGFSGDDPNFLSWIGWVRDELNANPPPVYLCGVLDLTPAQQRVLAKRGVTPVDLGPLVPDRHHPDRQRRALRWLLLTLLRARPPSGVTWPSREREDAYANDPDLPSFYAGPTLQPEPQPEHTLRVGPDVPEDDLGALARVWRTNRTLDPGWAVLPLYNRRALWRATRWWSDALPERLDDLDPLQHLHLTYEWVWRLERVLEPLADPEPVEHALAVHDPETLAAPLLDQWIFLAMALLRTARRDGDLEAFKRWADQLQPVAGRRPAWLAELCYERAQERLGLLDVVGARACLAEWPRVALDPLWDIRRASVASETGDTGAAHQMASDALSRVRAEGETARTRFAARSREGLAMLLADLTEPHTEDFFSVRGADTRWDDLNGVRCNPRADLEALGGALEGEPPGLRSEETTTLDAWGNPRTTVYNDVILDPDALRPAVELLGLFEHGLPFWSGLYVASLARAGLWVADVWPQWAVASLVRMLRHDELGDVLDRARVVSLPDAFAEALAANAVAALADATGRTTARGIFRTPDRSWSAVRTALVVLERLAFRLRPDVHRAALAQALQMVASFRSQREYVSLRGELRDLFGSLLVAVAEEDRDAVVASLLALPLVDFPQNAVDPYVLAPLDLRRERRPGNTPTAISDAITAVEGEGGRRSAGLFRLFRLHEAHVLTPDEQQRFAAALWSQTDDTGLPDLDPLFPWVLLLLPEPEPGRAQRMLKRALLAPLPALVVGTYGFGTTEAERHFLSWASASATPSPEDQALASRREDPLGSRIAWTPEDAAVLVEQVNQWWAANRDEPTTHRDIALAQRSAIAHAAARALEHVAMPLLRDSKPGVEAAITLQKMVDVGLAVRFALPSTLLAAPKRASSVESIVRLGIAGPDDDAADAAEAVYRWAMLHRTDPHTIPLPDALASDLVGLLSARRTDGVEAALRWITLWLQSDPSSFPTYLVRRLASTLRVLLDITGLPSSTDRLRARSVEARRLLLRRPDVRALAAALARTLQVHVAKDLDEEDLNVVHLWKAAVADDPYPAVRRAWDGAAVGAQRPSL